MAGKKLPKNFDIAAGFFSDQDSSQVSAPEAEPKLTTNSSEMSYKADVIFQKNLGGRPRKDGLKNEQFTLTMNPEMYEKLRIIASEHTRGNFSGLIDEAIKSYCREHDIDLASIIVASDVLDMYRKKQEKKSKKK